MNTHTLRQAAGLLTLFSFSACIEPFSDVAIDNWTPEVAAPLLSTSFTLRDAIRNTEFAAKLTEDSKGALHIGINEELFELNVGDRFEIPKLAIPLLKNETVINFRELGIELPISLIDFEDVRVVVQFINAFPSEATVELTSDNFTADGKPFLHSIKVGPGASATDTIHFDKTRFAISDRDDVTMRYAATLADGSKDVQMVGGLFSLQAKDFTYAEGYLSDLAFDLGLDSVRFDFLDAFEPGTVSLVNPRGRLVIENSVGAPVRLKTYTSEVLLRDGTPVALTSPLDAGIDLVYPTKAEGHVAKRSELIFDRETSNLEQVFNHLPNAVNLGIGCTVNAEKLKQKFFLHRDATVRGRLEVDVPLALQFKQFKVRKALALDASSLENAESASFLLRVENGFGLAAKAQVRFLDKDSVEVATLFPAPVAVLASATVDAFGRVTSPTSTDIDIVVAKDNLRRISTAVSAEVILTLDSPQGTGAPFTQLYYDNTIAVKLGAKVAVKPF